MFLAEYIQSCNDSGEIITLNKIPLSNSVVASRISKISENIEKKLIIDLQNNFFSRQLDETTTDSKAYLIAYVRYYKNSIGIIEEFLFVKNYETDTTGLSTFMLVKSYFESNLIPLSNIKSWALCNDHNIK